MAPPPGFACPSLSVPIKLCLSELTSTVSPDDQLPYLWLLDCLSFWTGRRPHEGLADTLGMHELRPFKLVLLLLADGVIGLTLGVTQAPDLGNLPLNPAFLHYPAQPLGCQGSSSLLSQHFSYHLSLSICTGFSLLRFILNSQLIYLSHRPPSLTPKPIHQVHFPEALL